jgi:hypothetical protein
VITRHLTPIAVFLALSLEARRPRATTTTSRPLTRFTTSLAGVDPRRRLLDHQNHGDGQPQRRPIARPDVHIDRRRHYYIVDVA